MRSSMLLVLAWMLLAWVATASGQEIEAGDGGVSVPLEGALGGEQDAAHPDEVPLPLEGALGGEQGAAHPDEVPLPLEGALGGEQGAAHPAEVPLPPEGAAQPTQEPLVAAEETGDAAGADSPDAATGQLSESAADGGEVEATAALDSPAAPAPPAEQAPLPVLGEIGYDAQGRPGRIHLVVAGDTLWDISDAYLGTPWVWPSIWKDNRDIENPHLIHPGDRIWITPSEMRRISPEEAAALLAGTQAPLEPVEQVPFAAPEPVEEPAELAALVPEERRRHLVSSREQTGLVAKKDYESASSLVGKVVDRLMLGQGDQVYIGLGEGDVEVGNQFTVFRANEKVFDPETHRLLGYHVDILGWLEVDEVAAESSLGRIRRSAREMEIGDRIMPREKLPPEVPVAESPVGVEGMISFFAHSRTVMGMIDYVYLNRGTLDGLEVGSPLEVYREGYLAADRARGERVQVPDYVVAQLLVVRAQPGTAVAYVTHTETELAVGDRFRGAGL